MAFEIDADFLETLADEVEFPDSLRRYSGRGMYSRQCLGFEGNLSDFAELILTIAQVFDPHTASYFTNVATDSMGLGSIFYWPSIKLSEDANNWLSDND